MKIIDISIEFHVAAVSEELFSSSRVTKLFRHSAYLECFYVLNYRFWLIGFHTDIVPSFKPKANKLLSGKDIAAAVIGCTFLKTASPPKTNFLFEYYFKFLALA